MSSILVTRRDAFPGVILNGMKYFGNEGVLDAKVIYNLFLFVFVFTLYFKYIILLYHTINS